MMGEEGSESRNQNWLKEWEAGNWDMVYTQPGQVLSKHFERVTEGRTNLKVLVPLAATTYDLIWLCEQGHTVVGADLAESAAQRLFKQYKQTPVVEDVPSINGKLYKNASGTFNYYVGDFFKFSRDLAGAFDVIWDSKAMCSIDENDRHKYIDVIRGVMGTKCILMLEFFKKKGESDFPYYFTEDDLKQLYGDLCDVEFLDEGVFDIRQAPQGDIRDDGTVVLKQGTDWRVGEGDDKDNMEPFKMECYCIKKRE